MPRDAKRMKPTKMWALLDEELGGITVAGDGVAFPLYEWERDAREAQEDSRYLTQCRIALVEIRELPPKRKRHAT